MSNQQSASIQHKNKNTRQFLRRSLRFLSIYITVAHVDYLLRRGGFSAARNKYLIPWSDLTPETLSHEDVQELGWIVERACAWQRYESQCLHRAITAYHHLRLMGGKPYFHIGVSSRPFGSHAWVELDGSVIADSAEKRRAKMSGALLRIPQ